MAFGQWDSQSLLCTHFHTVRFAFNHKSCYYEMYWLDLSCSLSDFFYVLHIIVRAQLYKMVFSSGGHTAKYIVCHSLSRKLDLYAEQIHLEGKHSCCVMFSASLSNKRSAVFYSYANKTFEFHMNKKWFVR